MGGDGGMKQKMVSSDQLLPPTEAASQVSKHSLRLKEHDNYHYKKQPDPGLD